MLRADEYPPDTVPPALKLFVYCFVIALVVRGAYDAGTAAVHIVVRWIS